LAGGEHGEGGDRALVTYSQTNVMGGTMTFATGKNPKANAILVHHAGLERISTRIRDAKALSS
jgi:hypothetical protein